jgi:hypothetical protein
MIPKTIKINLSRQDHISACSTSQPFAVLHVKRGNLIFKAKLAVFCRPGYPEVELLAYSTRGSKSITLHGQEDDLPKAPKKAVCKKPAGWTSMFENEHGTFAVGPGSRLRVTTDGHTWRRVTKAMRLKWKTKPGKQPHD